MNKYLKAYETLCPGDILCLDDPRRPAIKAEMKAIHKARTVRDAASIINWWNVWPNEQHSSSYEFVLEAWKLMGSENKYMR